MSRRLAHLPFVFILSLGLALSACSSQRLLTLPDGRKVPPAPSYVSAKEMAERGKNLYGVPETNFAFYPEGYVPKKENIVGESEEKAKAYFNAMKAHGRVAGEFRFMPANVPRWDRSYVDSPTIRHDCFTVERLFVVPWGSGVGEVGKSQATGNRLTDPMIAYRSVGEILLWDRANARVHRFNFSGQRLQTKPAKSELEAFEIETRDDYPFEDEKIAAQMEKMSSDEWGDKWQWLSDGRILNVSRRANVLRVIDPKLNQPICKTYFPWTYDPELLEAGLLVREESSWPRYSLHPSGVFILPKAGVAGIEFYLYRVR